MGVSNTNLKRKANIENNNKLLACINNYNKQKIYSMLPNHRAKWARDNLPEL